MSFPEFGKWCNCTGYLAKDKNEICILASPPVQKGDFEKVFAHIPNPNGDGYVDDPLECGDFVVKPLLTVVNKSFSGIIVGRSAIPTKETLQYEHNDYPYQEYDYIDKSYFDFVDCYTVFFGNNRKRRVPVEMAQMITKE